MSRVPLKKRKYVIAAATNDFPPDYEASCTSSGRSSYPDSPPDLSTVNSPGRTSHPDSHQDLPPFNSHLRSSQGDPLQNPSTLNSPPQTPPAVHGCGSTSQPLPFRPQRHKSHSPSSYYGHVTPALHYPTSSSPRQHSHATNSSPGLSSGYSSTCSRVSSTYPAASSPRIPSYPSTASPMQSNYSSSPSPMSSSYSSHPYRVASNYNSSTLSPMMSEFSLLSSPSGSDCHLVSAAQFQHERKEYFSPEYNSACSEISSGGVSSNPTKPIQSELVLKHPENTSSSPSQILIRSDLPKDLVNFLPPNLLQSVGTSSSSSDTKTDKKHRAKKFSYRIDGKPLNATTKQKPSNSVSHSSLVTKTLCSSLISDREREVGKESQRGIGSYEFSRGTENYPSETLTSSQPSSNFENLGGGTKVPLPLRTNLPDQKLVLSESSGRSSFSLAQGDQALHPNIGGVKRKKQQQCRYCTNHNIFVPVKGHKYNCEYRDCTCECCNITRQRQVAVREQQKQTRRQESQRAMRHVEEEETQLAALPHPSGYSTPPQYQHYGEDGKVGSSSQPSQRFSDAEHRFSQEHIEGN